MNKYYKFPKNNKIPYGQDFSFPRGIPSDVVFERHEFMETRTKLIGLGHGATNSYGNGAIFVDTIYLEPKYEVSNTPSSEGTTCRGCGAGQDEPHELDCPTSPQESICSDDLHWSDKCPQQPSEGNNWEKEFDNLDRTHGRIAWEKSIKPFIKSLLLKERQELVEKIANEWKSIYRTGLKSETILAMFNGYIGSLTKDEEK
jgi:hypothetical protein